MIVTIGLTGRVGVQGPVELEVATIALMQFVVLFGGSLFNVNGPSLRQALTPEHLLGRVNASYRFLVWGTGSFGALLGGALGAAVGLHAAVLLTGIGCLLAFPVLLSSALPHIKDVPRPEPSPVRA